MTRILALLAAIAALSLLPPETVHAQGQPQDEVEHPRLDAKACADREQLAFGDAVHLFERFEKDETTGAGSSEHLGRSDSVICPPRDLDPYIRAPNPYGEQPPAALERAK